jgi:hypothetical protein
MSYIDDRIYTLEALIAEFERDFNAYGRQFKRMLSEFIAQGFSTHAEVVAWFAGTGYMDTASAVVAKYSQVLDLTRDLAKQTGIRFMLPRAGLDMLALLQENKIAELLGSAEPIIRSVTDAAFRYGMGGESLESIIADMGLEVDAWTRRLSTEAFTGATIFERTSKFQLFENAGINKYFYSGPVDSKNREECAGTLGDNRQYTGWTMDEIADSQTPFIVGGGYNCRHEWLPFVEGAYDLIEEMAKDAGLERKVNIGQIESRGEGITSKEKESISYYSQTGFNEINTAMRKGEINENIINDINSMNSAIEKSSKYSGKTYRGLRFDNADKYRNFIGELKEGGIFQDKAFLSTSQKEDIASRFYNSDPLGLAKGRVKFEIYGKGNSGASMSDLIGRSNEGEVLFKSNTKFRIRSIQEIVERDRYGESINVIKILLDEIL